MTKYSILMTTHNASKYLEQSIQSVVKQTFENFELLIFDDKSTDGTAVLLNKFAQEPRIQVIFSKENVGVSSARNYLLEIATGDYILFIDDDDILNENILYEIEQNVRNKKSDLIVFNFERFSELKSQVVYVGATYLSMYTAVWNKAYKANLLHNIRFEPGVKLGEDTLFGVKAFKNAEKVDYLPVTGYHYRQRKGSLSHSDSSIAHIDAIKAVTLITNEFKDDMPQDLRVLLNRQMFVHAALFVKVASSNELEVHKKNILDMQDKVQTGIKRYRSGCLKGIKNNLFWLLFKFDFQGLLLKTYVSMISN